MEITENPKCKTNIISLRLISRNIKLYIQSYESLKEIEFDFYNEIINLKDTLPIFNNNSSIIFKSLTHFNFKNFDKKGISYSILNNIYNNIDNMPNLKEFKLSCYSKDIDECFYKKLIKKILLLNLDYIDLNIKKNYHEYKESDNYTLKEFNEMFPELNLLNINKTFIKKF